MIFWQLNAKLSENAMKDFTDVCVATAVKGYRIAFSVASTSDDLIFRQGWKKTKFKRIFKSFFWGGG